MPHDQAAAARREWESERGHWHFQGRARADSVAGYPTGNCRCPAALGDELRGADFSIELGQHRKDAGREICAQHQANLWHHSRPVDHQDTHRRRITIPARSRPHGSGHRAPVRILRPQRIHPGFSGGNRSHPDRVSENPWVAPGVVCGKPPIVRRLDVPLRGQFVAGNSDWAWHWRAEPPASAPAAPGDEPCCGHPLIRSDGRSAKNPGDCADFAAFTRFSVKTPRCLSRSLRCVVFCIPIPAECECDRSATNSIGRHHAAHTRHVDALNRPCPVVAGHSRLNPS